MLLSLLLSQRFSDHPGDGAVLRDPEESMNIRYPLFVVEQIKSSVIHTFIFFLLVFFYNRFMIACTAVFC